RGERVLHRQRAAAPGAAGGQGRLSPVRAELLPALSPRGTRRASRRHLHQSHRVPLRRARLSRCFICDRAAVSLTAEPLFHLQQSCCLRWELFMTTSISTSLPAAPDAALSVARALRTPRLFARECLAGVLTSLALVPEVGSFSGVAGVPPPVGRRAGVGLGVVMCVPGGGRGVGAAAAGAGDVST